MKRMISQLMLLSLTVLLLSTAALALESDRWSSSVQRAPGYYVKSEQQDDYSPDTSYRYTWNKDGTVKTMTHGALTATYTYDASGNCIKEVIVDEDYPGEEPDTFTYTYKNNRLVKAEDSDGETVTYQYDNAGQLVKTTETYGSTTGTVTLYTYNSSGQLTKTSATEKDHNNPDYTRVTTYTYNTKGQIATSTAQGGYEVGYDIDFYCKYAYDAAGNNTKITRYELDNGSKVLYDTLSFTYTKKIVNPTITTQPKAATVAAGKNAKFTVTASGPGLTYQWQVSKDSGKTWKNVSTAYPSALTRALSFKTAAKMNGYQYRCVVTNKAGKATSKAVKLTVK